MPADVVRPDVVPPADAEGVLRGAFRRYHPDGSLAREGKYVDGQLDGAVNAYVSEDGLGAPLRGCCVPLGSVRMEARYEQGSLRGETFFDAQGFPLLSDGERRPALPAGLPEHSGFDQSSRRWYHGVTDHNTGNSVGTWKWWSESGALVQEVDYIEGHRVAVRRFDEQRQLEESTEFLLHEGYEEIVHGLWRRLLKGDELIPWCAEPLHDAWIEGHFQNKQSVGAWSLRTVAGDLLWARDLGRPADEDIESKSPVFTDEMNTAEKWLAFAETLSREGRLRESLVARARAVALGADLSAFVSDLRLQVLPKSQAAQESEAQNLQDNDNRSVCTLLEALVSGVETVQVLRALCTTVPPWSCAARDLSEAAVIMEPERLSGYLTRALVRLERADDQGLQSDLQRLMERSADAETFFAETLSIYRPKYEFEPLKHSFERLEEAVELQVAQPLEAVLQVARVYATRLAHMRRELSRFNAEERPWSPPLLQSFLNEGPATLRKEPVTIEDQNDEGQIEETIVQIDETLELSHLGVSGIIRRARADWQGLCWLLWAVGLDEVAEPQEVVSRETYPQALALLVQRAWRARDQVVTSGLRSMTQGVPDFAWEGRFVSELPASLVDVCVDEWIEGRAVLLWLSNEGNVSPFQDDLRRV
jgi:hypothetical protein